MILLHFKIFVLSYTPISQLFGKSVYFRQQKRPSASGSFTSKIILLTMDVATTCYTFLEMHQEVGRTHIARLEQAKNAI